MFILLFGQTLVVIGGTAFFGTCRGTIVIVMVTHMTWNVLQGRMEAPCPPHGVSWLKTCLAPISAVLGHWPGVPALIPARCDTNVLHNP